MSGIIAGAGQALPNDIVNLDWKIASFTIASGATGSPYVVTGSTKKVSMNSAMNVSPSSLTYVQSGTNYIMYGLPTTTTTDTYVLRVQFSLDGGSTWTNFGNVNFSVSGPISPNVPFVNNPIDTVGGTITPASAFTNPIQFRLVFTDATSPTTDAFTVTNLRVTVPIYCVI